MQPEVTVEIRLPWRARFRRAARMHLRRRSTRAALAILAGGVLSAVCELLPETFRGPCHLAAKICQTLMGIH